MMFDPHHMSDVTCHMSHAMCPMSHATCYVSHVTCHVKSNFYSKRNFMVNLPQPRKYAEKFSPSAIIILTNKPHFNKLIHFSTPEITKLISFLDDSH